MKALIEAVRRKSGLVEGDIPQRFSVASFWLLLGTLMWRVPSALSTILIARLLGPVGFGQFGIISSTVSMFSIYGGLRMGATSAKFVAQYRKSDPPRAARVLRLTLTASLASSLLVSVLFLCLSPTLAQGALAAPELALPLAIGAFVLFFSVYGAVHEAAITGFGSFRSITKVGAVRGVATLLLSVPLTMVFGVTGAVASLASVSAIALVWLMVLLRRERLRAGFPNQVRLGEARGDWAILWQFALPGVLVSVLVTSVLWIGRLMLLREQEGYAALGHFEAANQWRNLVLFLPTVMSRAILPILAESAGGNAKGDFSRALRVQVAAVCIVTAPLAVLAIGWADILAGVFGRRFAESEAVVAVLMGSVFLQAINQALRQAFDGAGKAWSSFLAHILWAMVFVALAMTLVPRHGATGLAWATLGAECALVFTQGIYVESAMAQGSLKPNVGLFARSVGVIALQYAVWVALPTVWSATIAALLAILVSLPFLYRVVSRRLRA